MRLPTREEIIEAQSVTSAAVYDYRGGHDLAVLRLIIQRNDWRVDALRLHTVIEDAIEPPHYKLCLYQRTDTKYWMDNCNCGASEAISAHAELLKKYEGEPND